MAEQLPRGLLADPAVQRAMLLPVARRTFTDPGDDITEELGGLEFAAPGLLYDPMLGMAQTGAMLMGDMPVNPDVVTQTMLDAPLVSGLLSAATGVAPKGAVLGANVVPRRQFLKGLLGSATMAAVPKPLVSGLTKKIDEAEIKLNDYNKKLEDMTYDDLVFEWGQGKGGGSHFHDDLPYLRDELGFNRQDLIDSILEWEGDKSYAELQSLIGQTAKIDRPTSDLSYSEALAKQGLKTVALSKQRIEDMLTHLWGRREVLEDDYGMDSDEVAEIAKAIDVLESRSAASNDQVVFDTGSDRSIIDALDSVLENDFRQAVFSELPTSEASRLPYLDLGANKAPTAALPGLLDDAVGGRVQVPAIDARNPVAINIRGDIFPGATVEDAVKAATEGGMTESQIAQAVVGFMSNRGKFMDQQLAKMTARKSGQLKKGAQKGPRLALDDLDLTVAIKEITPGPIGVYRKTSTKNKSGKTTYAFGRAQSLEGQDPSKGGYALFKYSVNYDGNVRGGKRGSWGVVDRDLSFDEVKALMNKKVGFDAFSSPATAALPGLLQDRSGNIDQRGLLRRPPRNQNSFPMRSLLGQRVYTATMPDGSI